MTSESVKVRVKVGVDVREMWVLNLFLIRKTLPPTHKLVFGYEFIQ
jgi:hypothetical protein